MFCQTCGNQISDDARFCPKCGTAVSAPPDQDCQASESPLVQPNDQNSADTKPVELLNEPPLVSRSPASMSIDFDALKAKGKSTVRKIIGDDYSAAPAESGYEKHPHPYHNLGGWLGFITFGSLAGTAWLEVIAFRNLLYAYNGWRAFTQLIHFTGMVFVAYFCVKMVIMIRNKNPRFLRFYELMTLALVAINIITTMIMTGFRTAGYSMVVILEYGVIFAICLAYFSKSVRVRTYFGSDEYLRRSIFFKNTQAPLPADTKPYVPPQSQVVAPARAPTSRDNKTENSGQTEIGQLAVELQKAKVALKQTKTFVIAQIPVALASLFWIVFSILVDLGTEMIFIGVVMLVLDIGLLIQKAIRYSALKSTVAELERKISNKRVENQ